MFIVKYLQMKQISSENNWRGTNIPFDKPDQTKPNQSYKNVISII